MKNNYLTGTLMVHLSALSQIMTINAQELSGQISPDAPIKEVSLSLANLSAQEIPFQAAQLQNLTNSGEQSNEQYILVLNISGVVVKYSDYWNVGCKTYMQILDSVSNDPNIAGVILKMDTGGGSAHGTPEFAQYLKDYSKPVVAYVDGYCCSAGLYIAAGAQYIISSPHADAIGSAGTYTTLASYKKMYESMGIEMRDVYADESPLKNINSRQVFSEDNPSDEPYKKNVLTPLIKNFHSFLTASRPNISEEVKQGIEYYYNAELALENGLVDEIGSMQDAVNKVFELSNKINKSQNTSMSVELTNMAKALGVNALEVKTSLNPFDKSQKISLTVEQCSVIEQALASANPEALSTLTADLATARNEANTANQAKATAEASVTALSASINAALSANNLEAKGTDAENIALLSAKVKEYGEKGDAVPTNVHSKGEGEQGPEDPSATSQNIYNSIYNS